MPLLSKTTLCLMRAGALIWASTAAIAATRDDVDIELLKTTYKVSTDGSAEITYHQRWRAKTAEGRAAISKIQVA